MSLAKKMFTSYVREINYGLKCKNRLKYLNWLYPSFKTESNYCRFFAQMNIQFFTDNWMFFFFSAGDLV